MTRHCLTINHLLSIGSNEDKETQMKNMEKLKKQIKKNKKMLNSLVITKYFNLLIKTVLHKMLKKNKQTNKQNKTQQV